MRMPSRCPKVYLIDGRAPKGWQDHHRRVLAEEKALLRQGVATVWQAQKQVQKVPVTPRNHSNAFCVDPTVDEVWDWAALLERTT